MLKSSIIFLLIIFSFVLAENFAAKVNDEIIEMSTFNKMLEQAKQNLDKQSNVDYGSSEGTFILNTTKKSIINDMIDSLLIDQQAKEMNISVKEEDIVKKVADLKKGFPSQKSFSEALFESGITEKDLKISLKQQVLIEKIKKELTKKIKISDKEVKSFVQANSEFLKQPRRIQIFQIVTATEEEAREVIAKYNKGEDFSVLSEKYSIDMLSKDSGGNMGFIEEGTLDPRLEEVVLGMSEGEISDVVMTDEGFHVLKCGKILQEVNEQEVMSNEKIKEFLKQKKENIIFEEWFEKVKKEAEIEINKELLPDYENKEPYYIPKGTISNTSV